MRKKILMLVISLIFGSIFLIGCNKKEVQPEIVPTVQVTEVVEVESVGN